MNKDFTAEDNQQKKPITTTIDDQNELKTKLHTTTKED
ncbi:hypothetical protein SynBIOSE41_03046 [Synechococcus sp. BIOS-E4-1]|nr:hypothetical protein SynBIOSE41_03046 [Synechococcus sp. BIOS-E4-1]